MKNMTSLFRAMCLTAVIALPAGASAMEFTLENGTLLCDKRPVLENIPKGFTAVEDPTGTGVFLRFTARNSSSFIQTPLCKIAGLSRFTSTHRYEPFWMKPASGTSHADVCFETQWLLAETKSGDCVMLVPLIDGVFRFSISGSDAGLVLTGETGDPFTFGTGGVALFVSVGRDPYAMADVGAKAVMKRLATGKLRSEKPTPDFIDLFGWCTWDSFYKEVSADKVRTGLESFKAGGVEPRFLILDDGWQDYRRMPTGDEPPCVANGKPAAFWRRSDANRKTCQAGLQSPRVYRLADDVRILGRSGRQIAARLRRTRRAQALRAGHYAPRT